MALGLALAALLGACAHPEICNWEDDDRDGIIDEGFDADGDGWWACGLTEGHQDGGDYDCDDGNAQVNPEAEEACDGLDNNCDGAVDPGCGAIALDLVGSIASVAPYDLDGDQDDDLILFFEREEDSRCVLFTVENDGGGALIPTSVWEQGNCYTDAPTVMDWGDDGSLDIVALTLMGLDHFEGQLDGTFAKTSAPLWDPDVDLWSPAGAVAESGDRGDGLWVYGVTWLDTRPKLWRLEEGDGAWLLEEVFIGSVRSPTRGLLGGDVDGDSDLDLMAVHLNEVVWLERVGEGAFVESAAVGVEGEIFDAALMDVDRDGDLDLVMSVPERWRLYIAPFDGQGFGTPIAVDSFRHPGPLVVADFDHSGAEDLAVLSLDEARLEVFVDLGLGLAPACELPTLPLADDARSDAANAEPPLPNALIAMSLSGASAWARSDLLVYSPYEGLLMTIEAPCLEGR